MANLSIIIPSRNEMFLARTVKDILEHVEGDTEVIVTLDGKWADPPLEIDPRVTVIYHPESVGQRAAMNEAVRLSRSKYVMKCDAHCAFAQGFDVQLMKDIKDNWTIVPTMRNLHVFDWVCSDCGWRKYQGPTPEFCEKCNSKNLARDIVWIPKTNPQSNSYCFDSEPHFQYFGEWNKRPEGKGDITPTMSLQGSCFMLTREKYWELNIADEQFGSWGSQGIEVAVKTWLSGGQVMVDRNTWYAHMFRTQGGDFGFPYELSGRQVEGAKKKAKELFFNSTFSGQTHPLSWLLKKFWPVPGWTEEQLKEQEANEKLNINNKSCVYYTENRLDPLLMSACQNQLKKNNLPVISVSLLPISFGTNIVLNNPPGYLTMFKQILTGLEASKSSIIFLTEHDILYHPSHFDFIPEQEDVFYYNENVYHLSLDGKCAFYYAKRLSQLCAYRELLIEHFRTRVKNTENRLSELGNSHEFNNFIRRQGFEPGTHRREERVDDFKSGEWFSQFPNIDIKHTTNLTRARWDPTEFRNQKNCRGFKLVDEIPYWGKAVDIANSLKSGNTQGENKCYQQDKQQ
jgi:glycosyltransferase involved in cell wall biosynthesis